MKKMISFLLICTLFVLTACSSKKTTTTMVTTDEHRAIEDDKNKRYEFDLTMDNYWKFFDNTQVEYMASAETYNEIKYINKGILSYAYYEDVVFTLELSYTKHNKYAENEEDRNIHTTIGNVYLPMKADGSGIFVYAYNYLGDTTEQSLYWSTRYLKVVGISGKVIFSM